MEKKRLYIEKFVSKLNDWDLKIDRLVEMAYRSVDGSKLELSKRIEILRQKKEDAGAILKKLRAADAKQWGEAVEEANKAWDGLKRAMRSAEDELKK